MARQIIIVNIDQGIEEINHVLKTHFENNGFAYKKYRNDLTLSKEDRFGVRFFKVYYKLGILKIEAWIKAGKSEIALDDKFYGALAKEGLHRDVNDLMKVFSDKQCSTFNSDTSEESLNKDGYQVQSYDLKTDFKSLAFRSFLIGIVCLFIPIYRLVLVIACIGGIYYGIKGIRSSAKWAAIIGIILSVVNIIVSIITIF